MRPCFALALLVFTLGTSPLGWSQTSASQTAGASSSDALPPNRVPDGVILLKGAWSSASDSVTPLPEGGGITNGIFTNQYFGMTYELPNGWTEKYKGPPPSDTGRYVLAQLAPADNNKGARGSILIIAQDMFFTPLPAPHAFDLIAYMKDHLQADYKVETPPADRRIAGHDFRFFAYESPVAELHWYVAATEIRCHTVEFVLTSRDTKLLATLLDDMNKMTLPEQASPTGGMGAGTVPVCIKDYARGENIVRRVEPTFAEPAFNPAPVRIIIDKQGKIKHIHFLSAFPGQAKAVTDALAQWKFKPYLQDGHPVEVETGIIFGHAPTPTPQAAPHPANQ